MSSEDTADDLDLYREKRDPALTPEPMGGSDKREGPLLFCFHKHAATNLHYDLRLELDGKLLSWAVPKGPSLNPDDKRFAVHVEDHPLLYVAFEGVIPKGEYGGGEMVLWDTGFYTPDEGGILALDDREEAQKRIREELAAGKIALTFLGTKVKGSWTLVRTKDGWLLIKHTDRFVDKQRDLLTLERSVVTGRTVEDLRAGKVARPTPWPPESGAARFPAPFRPMLAQPIERPFDDPEWTFEPKLDGVRVLAFVENGRARLYSRNLNEITISFPEVAERLAAQIPKNFVVDGEIVGFDQEGRPGFHNIQQRLHLNNEFEVRNLMSRFPVVCYLFDILHFEGLDLRTAPQCQRRMILEQAIAPDPGIQIVHSVPGEGKRLFDACLAAGLEGIVAKHRDSRYDVGRRTTHWRKLRAFTSDEFIVVGYSLAEGGRRGFSALCLAQPDSDGALVYRGNVGTGFTESQIADMRVRLDQMKADSCPLATEPTMIDTPVWVRPEWVAEIKYAEITPVGMLRSPVFLRLREDKSAQELIDEARGVEATVEVRDHEPAPEPIQSPPSEFLPDILAQLDDARPNLTITVGTHKVDLSNLDKVYWPATETTPPILKRDLIRYYARIGAAMVPHLRDRPFTMIRFPEGINGEKFFQKHFAQPRPDYVDVIYLFSESNSENQRYVVCNNLPTLLWLGQLATLECHVWHSRSSVEPDHPTHPLIFTDSEANIEASLLNYPDFLTFDMDPYTYAGHEKAGEEPELNRKAFEQAILVGKALKQMLDGLGVETYVKTSGKTGLHVFVPIVRNIDFDSVRRLCGTLCGFIVKQFPHDATTEWQVDKRTGKVFLDFNMNVRGKTLAAAYSPRAHPGGPVSMPIRWEELDRIYPTDFNVFTAPDRVAAAGDVWSDIDSHKTDLRAIVQAMS